MFGLAARRQTSDNAPMDRLLTMRVFVAVTDEGGFSAAARKLDMSVPTVTRLVADLEQHLGTRLLQRTTRSVSLTGAGEAYLERVRSILAEVEDAFSMAQAHTVELSGVVRVLTVADIPGPNDVSPSGRGGWCCSSSANSRSTPWRWSCAA